MRQREQGNGLTINAIAGTHVVVLGLDLAEAQRPGCLGFAIQREDHTEDERYWMKGTKTFQATDPNLGPGGEVTSRAHPFQTFQWADYSAKPEHDYTYSVVPLYGAPAALDPRASLAVRVTTEIERGAKHSVYFNRGAVASQEYARRFLNIAPDHLQGAEQEAAYTWLSRGLLEALVAFIQRANGPRFGLYGAVYEFQWPAALQAIRAAADTGAQVHVVYDAIPGDTGPRAKNESAITAAHIEELCLPRTTGKIMHNKFFVLTEDNQPVAVWTGSTNLTENGLFGHSNLGHAIEDASIAAQYLAYWQELQSNPESAAEKQWIGQENPNPPAPWNDDLRDVFSPRSGLKVLEWYAELAGAAKPLFMTFAFGMNELFQQVYEQGDGILRFALMEKEGNGAGLAKGKADIARIRQLPNVVVAVGNAIVTNSFDRWLKEMRQLSSDENVRYIHTKYLLLDPLSATPLVVTGSANFSDASTTTNNENMIVMRNDTRVADIYVGEFMRLYTHYAFRDVLAHHEEWEKKTPWRPNYLLPDDSWQRDYFTAGHERYLRRRYFAGS
jgi:phosphatidylserine/phosphatidylglycerophosphate/cardiolipin synthase-like enzyme